MDPQQLQQTHSPRQIIDLNLELNLEAQNHFEFQEDNNPFSYYNEEQHRENSSDDQEKGVIAKNVLQKEPHSPSSKVETKVSKEQESPTKKIEIDNNLSLKPAIPLLQSPKAFPKTSTVTVNSPPPSLGMFRQAEFNLGSLQKQQPRRPAPATDRVYKSELNSDMQQLKKKFNARDSKKRDSKKQINLNKTYATIPRRPKQNTVQFEQMRMLVKMGFQKKKTNYEMLKEWDKRRADALALHGRIIDLLQNQVDIRIRSSLQNFQYYQTFFREKAKQEEKYSSSPVINTRYALHNNSLSKNVYINCSVILNSLCEENTTRCKKINDFVELIRHNILKELTQHHLATSQRELLKVREKISTLKSSLKKHNSDTEERANELALLFNEQAANITNTSQKDFYRTQLSFLRKAMHQIDVQRKLGEYCLQYYHTAVQEQLKRSQVIREAMVTYSRGLKSTYSLEPDVECVQIEQMSKQQEIKLIEEFFSLDEMFDERTLELFKLKTNIPQDQEITIDTFTQYVSSFDYQHFDSRILLLKEFQVKCTQGKGKQAIVQPCHLVITVDNFLHLFLNPTKEHKRKPDITIKIASKWIQMRPGRDQTLELIKKQQRRNSMMSYFWDNRVEKSYKLKFAKKDNRQEFSDYIGKLMVDQF